MGLEHRRTRPRGLIQHRFMVVWAREEEKASESRQRKRESGKVEFAPGVTIASLKQFGAVLIGPT